ncbi:MAG: tyrosine-type recombinase/integrase [Planctomycetes bacterium]|nr:tyrosine-type recombinase/integrase [Planctomycetota bacterium]
MARDSRGLARALTAADRELQRLGRAPRTREDVLAETRRFLAATGRAARAVRREDVVRYLAAAQRRGVTGRTQQNALTLLRMFFRALVTAGAVRADPTADVPFPQAGEPARLAVSEQGARALLVSSSTPAERRHGQATVDARTALARARRDRAALEVLFGLGVRSSEARTARVADLDLANGTLLVRRAKRGEVERLPLPPAALPHVASYALDARRLLLGQAPDHGLLLVRDDGRPFTYGSALNVLVSRVARRAGVRAHPHALRRGLATALVRRGASLPVVQALLGHKDLAVVAAYVLVDKDDLRRAVEALELERR